MNFHSDHLRFGSSSNLKTTNLTSKLLIKCNEGPTIRKLCPAFLVNLVKYSKHAPYHFISNIYYFEQNDKSCITKTSRLIF